MNNKGPTQEELETVRKMFEEKDARKANFIKQHGHIKIPQMLSMNGKAVTLVGGTLYLQQEEGPYNFANVIHDHALHFFGDSYLDSEDSKPLAERHPAIQWMNTYVEHIQKLMLEKPQGRQSTQDETGAAAWQRFAYDLHTIRDNARLKNKIRKELLTADDFQSARHELRVAAMCIAAGFSLEFEDEADNNKTHPEFIATDRFSGTRIAVEAKSRRRRGAYGFKGGKDIKPGTEVNIRGIVLDAYRKQIDLPFYAFIDTNLPPVDSNEAFERWQREIDQTMLDLAAEGYATPNPANVVFFSNDPSHYLIEAQSTNANNDLWISHYFAVEPRIAHPQEDILARLLRAHEQRVAPPENPPQK